MSEVEDVPEQPADPRVAKLAEAEALIADLTGPDKVSWGGNSEALRRARAERQELRAELGIA